MQAAKYIYRVLESGIRFSPFLGRIPILFRPQNAHFKRYKKYAERNRFSESDVKTECNSLWNKKPQAKVSIVITSFNYEKYIEQAIES